MATASVTSPAGSRSIDEIRAEFPILERRVNGQPLAYLDNGATAQTPLQVLEAMDRYWTEHNANVHRGVHTLSEEATNLYEGARATIARHLGANPRDVIFTRNVTGALNLVAHAWGRANVGEGDRILLTEMEHHSNIVPWYLLAKEVGAELDWVPVDDEGRLDMTALEGALERGPKLIAVAHISNVLGTVNPIADIVRLAHDAGAIVVVDGAQAAPKLPLDLAALGADFYGFTGHKVYGPTGVGVLYARRELLEEMPPFLAGGDMISSVDFQESRWNALPWKFEAGTSPYVEAAGLGAAIRWLAGLGLEAVQAHEMDVVRYAIERLSEVDGVSIIGPVSEPRGTAISFAVEGTHPHDVAEIVGRDGVCVRAGHHCAQPLMRCLGVPATSRASIGVHNVKADVDRLIEGLAEVKRIFA
jgi:cysteine desulfurase/selenocysteine lyase